MNRGFVFDAILSLGNWFQRFNFKRFSFNRVRFLCMCMYIYTCACIADQVRVFFVDFRCFWGVLCKFGIWNFCVDYPVLLISCVFRGYVQICNFGFLCGLLFEWLFSSNLRVKSQVLVCLWSYCNCWLGLNLNFGTNEEVYNN